MLTYSLVRQSQLATSRLACRGCAARAGTRSPPSARAFFAAARSGLRRRCGRELPGGASSAGNVLVLPAEQLSRHSAASVLLPLGGQVRGGRSPLHEIRQSLLVPVQRRELLPAQTASTLTSSADANITQRQREKRSHMSPFWASADLSSHFVAASLAFFSSGVGGSLVPDHTKQRS